MALLLNALIGEYRVTELLGAGGMGEVFKATHTHLGRVIAIKVLSSGESDPATVQRFYSEANIQASLRHPGVAEYLGFYEYQGRPCILMEFVDGTTLSSLLERRGALPVKEAISIARSITAVVAHFHQQGVLHRDIKTSNVKITSDGTVKVLDFGIARFQKANNLTRTGMVVGTPGILAPEQIRGQAITPATDVWQLGVLMYEMVTSKLPFDADNTPELYAQILNAKFKTISSLQPSLLPTFEKIVSRCLQKDPNKRFSSGADLLVALDALAERQTDEPSTAPKLKSLANFKSLVPIRRIAVITAGAVVLVAVVVAMRSSRGGSEESLSPCVEASAEASAAEMKTIKIDTSDGPAQVYCNNKYVHDAPYDVQARIGDSVVFELRRKGYKQFPMRCPVTERPQPCRAPDLDPEGEP